MKTAKRLLLGLPVALIIFAATMFFFWNRTYPTIATCFDGYPDLQITTASTIQANSNAAVVKVSPILATNVQQLVELHTFGTVDRPVTALAISSDNAVVASGYTNGVVNVFYLATGESKTLSQNGIIGSLAISPNNKVLAFYNYDGKITLWDIATHIEIANWDVGHSSDTNKLLFTTEGELIYSSVKSVYQCNLQSRENRKLFDNVAIAPLSDIILDVATEKLVYSTLGDNDSTGKPEVGIWDFDNPDNLQTFNLHNTQITDISVSLDGGRIASVSLDGIIKLVDVQLGADLSSFNMNNDAVSSYSIAANTDGSLLIIGDHTKGGENALSIWDVAKGSWIDNPNFYAEVIFTLMFNAAGNLIISGSADGTVQIWGIPHS